MPKDSMPPWTELLEQARNVARGKAPAPPVTDFCKLIRDFNTTAYRVTRGRELEQMHKLKAKLQMRLIEEYPEAMTVRRQGGEIKELLFFRRASSPFAPHASAAHLAPWRLPPKGREWVKRELARQAERADETPEPETPPLELARMRVARGELDLALEEYVAAMEGLSPEEAEEIVLEALQTCYDHGMFELATEWPLDEGLAGRDRVRAQLAWAYATLGQADRARRLAEGLPPSMTPGLDALLN